MNRALALTALLSLASPVYGHEEYPPDCCGGGPNGDCRPALPGEIVEAPGGYRVIPSGETFTYRDPKVRPSHDHQFHRCLRFPKDDPKSPSICILVVVGGS